MKTINELSRKDLAAYILEMYSLQFAENDTTLNFLWALMRNSREREVTMSLFLSYTMALRRQAEASAILTK